jgi:general secretion pathway protein K
MMRRNGSIAPRHGGAAIVTALLVVTIAVLVVSALFWRIHVTVRSVENRLALAQTRWIERSVLDWARVVLRADLSANTYDCYKDLWATPIENTQLDETVTGGGKVGDAAGRATLRGVMIDAQSRLNLNLLVDDPTDGPVLQSMRRLLESLGQTESLAQVLQQRLRQGHARVVGEQPVPAVALPLIKVDDLRFVKGFDDAVIEALRPYVILLPRGGVPTRVNLNTAEPIVVAAVTGLDMSSAARLGPVRDRELRSLNDARLLLGNVSLDENIVGVSSNFFIVSGGVRYDRVDAWTESLIQRTQGGGVIIIWQQRTY